MKSIFKTLFLSLCIIANTHFAYAQTASILPQGKTQFTDNNGKPLASGTVDFYIPSTTTRKTTWQNSGETISNTNPVVLDGGGRAIIYGDGNYRMVVKDRLGNLIYDQLTSSTGTGSSAPTATGDGDLVGTIKPWAGMTAPSQYLFTYGQEVSRTTYAALYTAITSTQPVFCNSGSPTLTSVGDTTNFWIGMPLEISCVVAGFSTVVSKTASSVTMAANANVSTNTTATFFPFGRGNGSTTFNLPDLRGVVLAGNNNMGGVASSNLTTAYFGATDPNSIGALGGNQSTQLSTANVPSIASTNHVARPISVTSTASDIGQGSASNGQTGGGGRFITSNGAITSTGTIAVNAIDILTASPSGGAATAAFIGNAGSGYTNGSQTITVAGGICTVQPQFTITVSGNVFTGSPALLTAGNCSSSPTNPAATTGGGGTGGTLNVAYTGYAFSNVTPTRTTNYIIKVTPDANSATASGVTAIQGMTGSISCVGTGITCTGNNITVNATPTSITINSTGILSGTAWGALYNNNGLVGNTSAGTSGYMLAGNGSAAPTFQGFTQTGASALTRTWQNKSQEWRSLTDFAKCDGVTDDTTAIQAAIASLPTNGGTIFVPNGAACIHLSGITQGSRSNVVFQCSGNETSGTSASYFIYGGTGATRGWDLRDSSGWEFRGCQVIADQATFTGTIIDAGGTNPGTTVSSFFKFLDGYIGGQNGATPTCINLSEAIEAIVAKTNIAACTIGIRGQQTLGTSTTVTIGPRNQFIANTSSITDCGEGWNITENIFEGTTSNPATSVAQAFTNNSARPCKGITFFNNWTGDATNSGTWFTLTANGAHFSGGRISNGAVGIALVAGTGYNFDGIINESTTAFTCASTPTGGRFGRNNLATATTILSGTCKDFDYSGLRTTTPQTKTADYTYLISDGPIIFNKGSTATFTLLAAASFPGYIIKLKTIQAQTVVSATSNVVPLAGGAAGTAILAATAGKWATLQSDGSNWVIMESN